MLGLLCLCMTCLAAVYLAKRSIQQKASLELDDYEQDSLSRLQKLFTRKWNWIMMQAESQAK